MKKGADTSGKSHGIRACSEKGVPSHLTNHSKNNSDTMNTNKKNLWNKILKVLIAVLSAIAGALGAHAMGA